MRSTGPLGGAGPPPRPPELKPPHMEQAGGGGFVARLAGQLVAPHDMVHGPPAVFLHGAREPRGRVAEPRAELEDLSSVAESSQQVAQVSRRRTDDGEAGAPRLRFQLGEPRRAWRHEVVQVRGYASSHEVHRYTSPVSLR